MLRAETSVVCTSQVVYTSQQSDKALVAEVRVHHLVADTHQRAQRLQRETQLSALVAAAARSEKAVPVAQVFPYRQNAENSCILH